MNNPFPPNPMLIHIIQDKLNELKGNDLVSIALRDGAKTDLSSAIQMAFGMITDNKRMANEILGEKLISEIKTYVTEHIDGSEPDNGAFAD